jgi:FixJ family two-component response regulator
MTEPVPIVFVVDDDRSVRRAMSMGKVRLSQLMKKMGADSLPDLVRMAEKIGLVKAAGSKH